ncbi:MAG: phosphatase PAP2 family protein [Gemmataceae bacterium]|nr:phosphatase PAP2 family protein [Gemmataceae bacterium]
MHHPEAPHVPVLPRPGVLFALAGALLIFFVSWSWFANNDETIPAFDYRVASHWKHWTDLHANTWKIMQFFTELGGIASMTLLVVVGMLWQTSLNHRFIALAWLTIVLGGALANVVCKESFSRTRPQEALRHPVVYERNLSYPSGHAMGSAIGYGMLGYTMLLTQRRRGRRIITILTIAAVILMIGFSRIFLRAHWFSDVIGGWAIGMAWLCFCLGWLERYRRQRRA